MNSHKHSSIEEILRSAKLRCTAGREAILAVLLKSAGPLTQEQIAAKLKSTGLNKVTIYRALESFIEADLVHKVFLHKRSRHFELARNCSHSQCHPHFTCTSCGQTTCFTDVSIPLAKTERKGFSIRRQQVQLEGLCPNCSE